MSPVFKDSESGEGTLFRPAVCGDRSYAVLATLLRFGGPGFHIWLVCKCLSLNKKHSYHLLSQNLSQGILRFCLEWLTLEGNWCHLLTTLSAEATLFSAQCVWETEPILCVRYLAYILILILPLRLKSVPILQMQWTQQITKKLWKVEPKFKTLPLLSFLHTQVHACVRTHCQDRLVRRHTLSSIQIYLVNKCQHWSSGFILASLMHHQVEVRGPGARQHVSAAPYFPVFQNHRGVNIVTQWK